MSKSLVDKTSEMQRRSYAEAFSREAITEKFRKSNI